MPEIGEISKVLHYRKNGKRRYYYYIWKICEVCHKGHWASINLEADSKNRICSECNKERIRSHCIERNTSELTRHPRWKGGKTSSSGYPQIYVSPDSFFAPMRNQRGYVFEHRLVMAQYLNRCLLSWEVVHHKNGIRTDCHLENLQLLPDKKFHVVDSLIKSQLAQLQKRVTLLESENILLKKQLKEISLEVKNGNTE